MRTYGNAGGAAFVLLGAVSTWAFGIPVAVVIALLLIVFGWRL